MSSVFDYSVLYADADELKKAELKRRERKEDHYMQELPRQGRDYEQYIIHDCHLNPNASASSLRAFFDKTGLEKLGFSFHLPESIYITVLPQNKPTMKEQYRMLMDFIEPAIDDVIQANPKLWGEIKALPARISGFTIG